MKKVLTGVLAAAGAVIFGVGGNDCRRHDDWTGGRVVCIFKEKRLKREFTC